MWLELRGIEVETETTYRSYPICLNLKSGVGCFEASDSDPDITDFYLPYPGDNLICSTPLPFDFFVWLIGMEPSVPILSWSALQQWVQRWRRSAPVELTPDAAE